ncbi:MAG TPA: hypothetical protein VIT19_00485 [Pyrinomonadaceae bacterium]
MRTKRLIWVTGFAVLLPTLTLTTSSRSNSGDLASELNAPYTIQAQAMGTSTQLGRNYNITARVKEYSPPEDQAILLEAFKAKGNEGLVNALSKMPAKGRLAITGTLGGDLAYIRRFDQPDGSIMLRMITNRLLRFGEVWADSRSSDYQLSGLEIVFTKDGKSTGTLIPAAQLKLDKQERIGIETFQWPWNLVNIQIR